MSEQVIDTITRRAADAFSRRASLLALGGMALAAVTAAPSAPKGNKNGKDGKNRKKNEKGGGNVVAPVPTGERLAQAKCAPQGDQCRTSLTAICAGNTSCLGGGLVCCDLFATCNAAGALSCIFGSA